MGGSAPTEAHEAPATNKHLTTCFCPWERVVFNLFVMQVLVYCFFVLLVLAHGTLNGDGNQRGIAYVWFFHCCYVGLKTQQETHKHTYTRLYRTI